MSSPSIQHETGSVAGESADGSLREWFADQLVDQIYAVGFWTAIVLPFLHVPMLATGLDTGGEVLTFLGLLALNALALLVGYPHKQ